ncbi:MAG: Type IV secretion system protein virB8 [Syntrophorhabdus sp. PtaU1.Bin153]|nr:MAG: Type IV secretion system protein virB8 [Syntrophorhabdus sp. PtaU1.Bin153]
MENEHFQKALDWETSRTEQIEKSERTAWMVAKVASGVAILSTAAIVLMLPLKETVPYLVRVDKNTGHTDIVTTLKNKTVSFDDVTDKYWLAKFVKARESWEWYTAQEDYDNVRLLGSPNVGKEYAKLFEGPQAIDKQYGQGTVVTVEIRSVVPHGNGQASVRFDKKIKSRDAQDTQAQVSTWIATIGYEYKKVSKMKENERLKNPLGFQAMSYRVDSEITRPAAPAATADHTSAPVVPALIAK